MHITKCACAATFLYMVIEPPQNDRFLRDDMLIYRLPLWIISFPNEWIIIREKTPKIESALLA